MATDLTKAMKGSLCHGYETELPAADVWEVYGGLLARQLVPQLVPEVYSKFIKIDNENYIKEALIIEGGFLDRGFQKYLIRIEIIGKEEKTSIVRSTVEYEVHHGHENNPPVASTSGLAAIAEAITKYIKEKRAQALGQLSEEQSIQLN
ncbi:hypothetical protein SETIT_8G041700v2 [Setaria italica]|uniref:Bet v I/Major latex protein domain-containing protein n=1 Tax=Setaria italica TaxID=4555 RepID=K3ZMR9_SETIT|nr:hypothetical protein SETIT_8G041700v2 [Setaria italica]